jgi:hypothetical protein
MNRKDGLYNVKINGKWVLAKWTTNQDIDSSWCCWWIEGVEPKAWGWSDEDFEEINETPIEPITDNEISQFKEITEDDIKEALKKLGLDKIPKYGYIGNGTYQIGDNCFTGKKGWDAFNVALRKESEKYLKQNKIDRTKKRAIEYCRFRDIYKMRERQKMNIFHKELGGLTTWVGTSDEDIYEAYLKNEQHGDPLEEAKNLLK